MPSTVGVKIGSYPADVLWRNLVAKANAEEMEIDKVIAGLKRQRQTNQVGYEECQAAVGEQNEKKVELKRMLREKLN